MLQQSPWVRTARLSAAGGLLLLGSLLGPAQAQSVNSSIDQPTPATLPPGTHATGSAASPDNPSTGRVAPPSAIRSSTDVMKSGSSLQGEGSTGTVNPIQHLPKDMRR